MMFEVPLLRFVSESEEVEIVGVFDLIRSTQLWNHGNREASCCTIASSGQASAKALMYLRLRGERPCISGNA
jgi:hypothetical protein